ncbi:hypothetical protein C8N40_101160 [Pontibacter mucosus]|uniref:MABP domain-containing protein n=1 Tax=Pontibacter mucosus TaxID=1649266 RepID=A0A2T5YSN8_9BACT|nr:hypothetical protein [Pontibacter mucosus]PTX22337.1 hypothetical protein C8N40_101160 [Pontibacter mucosus]
MRKRTFTLETGSMLTRLLLFVLLSTTVFLWSCEKAEEAVQPDAKALAAKQVLKIKSATEKEDKDITYKTDKTGQYVSKDVQVTGFEDGSERPTRPKKSIEAASTMSSDPLCPYSTDCTGGGGGTGIPPSPPTFVSSESIGEGSYYYNSRNLIQDLKIIKGSSSSIGTSDLPGYYKIPVDLNKGAGGKYIYLCFTRNPERVVGSSSNPGAWVNDERIGWKVPVRGIVVKPQSIGPANSWPNLWTPPIEMKDPLGFHCPDLNDGAGGKYIYAYQQKDSWDTSLPLVKEVGVLYGSSSSIQPPPGWVRIPQDLNEGAGGDYIYFCVKFY